MSDTVGINTRLWLGIDLGTTSVKIALIDHQGRVLIAKSRKTLADVRSDVGDHGYEQCPHKIMGVVEGLIEEFVIPRRETIEGVGITGQMHGVMLWQNDPCNKDSKLCSNLYTWQDQRCSNEFLASLPSPSDPSQTVSTGYGCATLYWLAHHRTEQLRDQGYTACGTIMDYLVCELCGLDHPVTSDQLATSFGYYNKESVAWDRALFQDSSFPQDFLPHIVPPGTVVGHTKQRMSLSAGLPVLVAMGDVQCAMQAVLKSPQEAAVNISTSIQLGFIVPKEREEEVIQESPAYLSFIPFFSGHQLALFAGLNGGNTIQCFTDSICQWTQDLGLAVEVDPLEILERLVHLSKQKSRIQSNATSLPVTTNPLTFKPVLFGERHNTTAKASLSGLDFCNLRNVGLVFHALCEGIVDHLHNMVSAQYLTKLGIQRLLVSGSVPVSNEVVMNRLMQLYSHDECKLDDIALSGTDDQMLPHMRAVDGDTCGSRQGEDKGAVGLQYSGASADNDKRSIRKRELGGYTGRDIDTDKSRLEVVMDTQGLEAVSSAVGAARVARENIGS